MAAIGLCGGLGFAGCAGGQSGNEGLCGEGMRQDVRADSRIPEDGFETTGLADEDGGTDDVPDAAINFASDDNPEAQSEPKQCTLPPDGDEY